MPVAILDVPLRGTVTDRLGKTVGPGQATELLNSWRTEGEVRSRPGLVTFGNVPNTNPIFKLFNAELASGTKTLVRVTKDSVHSFGGTTWTNVAFTGGAPTGSNSQPFSVCMANNNMIMGNGVAADRLYYWPGSGNVTKMTSAGVLTGLSAKFVTHFATRVIGAYTSGTNGAVTIIGSEAGLVNNWVAANGAFTNTLIQHPSYMTGLAANDNELLVFKERAVIQGLDTGNPNEPIVWNLLRTEGIGLIAPQATASYGGVWFAVSYEGIYTITGGQIQFVDSDIRRDFHRRFNYASAQFAHTLVMPEFAKILFFVPEGGETYPRAAWVYDANFNGWDRWETTLPITTTARAFVPTGLGVIDSYGSPSYLIDTGGISNMVIDEVGAAATTPSYIFGDSNGKTYSLDFGATDDVGSSFSLEYQSGDITWVGARDEETGHTILSTDVVVFDRMEIEYRFDALGGGGGSTLEASVSVDGGATWTILGSQVISSTSSLYTKLDFWGRVSGNQLRIRLRISQVVGRPRFRAINVFGKWAGERR